MVCICRHHAIKFICVNWPCLVAEWHNRYSLNHFPQTFSPSRQLLENKSTNTLAKLISSATWIQRKSDLLCFDTRDYPSLINITHAILISTGSLLAISHNAQWYNFIIQELFYCEIEGYVVPLKMLNCLRSFSSVFPIKTANMPLFHGEYVIVNICARYISSKHLVTFFVWNYWCKITLSIWILRNSSAIVIILDEFKNLLNFTLRKL